MAADPSGIPQCRCQPNKTGELVRRQKTSQICTGGTLEFGNEDRPKAGHAQQHLDVPVFRGLLADQRIQFFQFLVQTRHLPGEGGDNYLPDGLGRSDGLLGLRGFHRSQGTGTRVS